MIEVEILSDQPLLALCAFLWNEVRSESNTYAETETYWKPSWIDLHAWIRQRYRHASDGQPSRCYVARKTPYVHRGHRAIWAACRHRWQRWRMCRLVVSKSALPSWWTRWKVPFRHMTNINIEESRGRYERRTYKTVSRLSLYTGIWIVICGRLLSTICVQHQRQRTKDEWLQSRWLDTVKSSRDPTSG